MIIYLFRKKLIVLGRIIAAEFYAGFIPRFKIVLMLPKVTFTGLWSRLAIIYSLNREDIVERVTLQCFGLNNKDFK